MSANAVQRGCFIVLEGIDGCGSTTQAKLLAERLRERGRDVVLTCEPTSGPVGTLIRKALQRRLVGETPDGPSRFSWATLALLFAADRVDHVKELIEPALLAGKWVVSDRYDLSSLAYQSLSAASEPDVLPWLRDINRFIVRPDLTIVIDVPADVAQERRALRGGSPELFEVSELQRKLANVYAEAERLVPLDALAHVGGVDEPSAVLERILSAVDASLPSVQPA